MIGSLAKNTPGEICREIIAHEADVTGLVVFAFTPHGELVWGITGMVTAPGMIAALNTLHAEVAKMTALVHAIPMGRA